MSLSETNFERGDTCSSRKAENEVDRPVEHWTSVGLQVEEEEGSELDTSIRPELADDEAFKELQQCLPDILQRSKKFTSSHKKHPVNKFQSSSEMHLKEETGVDDRARIENEPSPDANNMDDFAKAFSTPDLRWQSKIKRHGSLTTALSNKASRVKSKLTTSFFKKGKKIDTRNQKDLMSKITTFSGYLLRKKGSVWRSRWCVVKEHSFFCYKDFDTGVSELEFQLEGCNVNCVQESVAERPFTFSIRFRDEVVVLAAENDAEFEEWIMVLRTECSANNSSYIADDNSSKVMSSSAASPSQGGVEFHNPNTDDCKETFRTSCADRGYPSLPSQNLTVKQKLSTVSSRGKKAIFSSLTNRLGHKSKAKPVNLPNNTASKQQQKNAQRIEDGFVIVPCEVTADQQISPGTRTDEDYSKEGYLFQRLDDNAWCRCWVKLENQYLHIFDDKECKAAVAVKIRLINCIVLDCESDVKPWILEVRRKFGQSLFLHADNKTEYDEWKKAISKSIVSSPFPPRQSSADQSVFHPEEIRSPDECDGRTEEVFHNGGKGYDDSQGIRSSAPSLPLNQSPRPSTAGDISSAESEEGSYMRPKVPKGTVEGSQPQTESAGVNKKTESPRKNRKVRRAVTNAFSSKKAGEYTARKRRSRTVAGVNVSLTLLTDVKHSSCLYIKNASGLWAKRWCVLQNDNLHFYKNAEDQNPSLSLNIKQPCEVRRVMKRSRRFTFDLALPQEHAEYCFAADNEAEMYRWMEILKNSLRDSRKELESEVVPWQNRVFDLIRTSEISRKPAINKDFQDVFDNSLTDTHLRASSLHDLRLDNFNRKNSVGEEKLNRSSGDVSTSVYRSKITSLEEVLKLLQDQRLLQQIGQTKQDKSKRVKLQWKRSAVVALDRSRSSPPQQQQKPNTFAGTLNRTDEKLGSPAAKRKESVIKTDEMDGNSKKRATSMLSLSSSGTEPLDELLSCGDIMEKVEKLAEEEKLQLLKNETLLRKRRNSLSLEKGVLERNRSKNLEKKSAVRKLLAKENSSKVTTTHVSEARLQEVTHQLMKIERSLEENKKQSADVNTKIMKSKLTRQKSTDKSSLISRLPGSAEERRAAFKNSSNSSERSFSSQGSFDEKFGKDSSDVTRTSLTKKVSLSSSISSSTSLATLEEELRKITPKVPRRFTETRRKKISLSSDCSPDTRESPPISRRAYSDLSKRTASASSESSSPGRNSPGFSGLEFSSSFDESSSLWTELDGQRKFSDSSQIAFGKRVRDDCPDTVNVLQGKNITVKETQNTQQEHQATFINALSKIKDFEEFTASVSKLSWDQI